MNLKELAKLAGVSVSTASRVLNKNDVHAAGEETRARIWELAHEGNYTPNLSAQSLKRAVDFAPAYTVGCVFARTAQGKSDPFFSVIYRAVEHECLKNGCVITGAVTAPAGREGKLALGKVDGVIILGRYPAFLFDQLHAICKNIVYTGLNPADGRCDQVLCDGYGAARKAVRYLHTLGHRHIGYLGEKTAEARYRGFFDAMQELRLPLERQYLIDADQSVKGGYVGGQKLLTALSSSGETLATPPTAVFCANDITAQGLLQAAKERHIDVPSELSVVSIDNTEMCQKTSPMLTSIDIPKEDLGRFAVKLLLDRLAGEHRLPVKLEIPYTLLIRESCAPPREKGM